MNVKHYLVYHSGEKMGHGFRDDAESTGAFGVVTRKNLSDLPDSLLPCVEEQTETWLLYEAVDLRTMAIVL
jgi:hypothetical protein